MTSKPHDALFKAAFRSPEHAHPLIRQLLPARAYEAFDWRTLAPEPGSFMLQRKFHEVPPEYVARLAAVTDDQLDQ